MNLSCTAAVDILNDLLCYEKLESGILELHKEEFNVGEYLRDRVNMFCAQARECGVTLTLITDFQTYDSQEAPTPTQSPTSPGPVPHPSSSTTMHLFPLPQPLSPPLSHSPPIPISGTMPIPTVQSPSSPAQSPTSPSSRAPPPSNILPSDTMFVDKFKMDQVIRNLISNSLKFTPQGGTVTVRATFQPDSLSGIRSPRSAREIPRMSVGETDHVSSNINIRKYQTGNRIRNEPRNWRFLRSTTNPCCT